MFKDKKIAVLMGGHSGEREISLLSGQAVLEALVRQNFNAHAFDPAQQTLADLAQFDCAFIALHGRGGEDGTMQGVLESLRIPYTGSGVLASALGMDKWRSKLIWQAMRIATPTFYRLDDETDFAALVAQLPLMVKPAREGSSIGVSKVNSLAELLVAYQHAKQFDPLVIAEHFMAGKEYTVGVLNRQGQLVALPIVRIEPKTAFYDYEAKYLRSDTEYHCPCGLDAALEQQIQAEALQAFQVLGGTGWGRVDFMLDAHGQHTFIEINTSPGMTNRSLVPKAAERLGLSFDALVVEILGTAHAEHSAQ